MDSKESLSSPLTSAASTSPLAPCLGAEQELPQTIPLTPATSPATEVTGAAAPMA